MRILALVILGSAACVCRGDGSGSSLKARRIRNFTARDFECERTDGRTAKSVAWAMQRLRRLPRPRMPSDLRDAAAFSDWKVGVVARERVRLKVPDDVRAPFKELSVQPRDGYALHELEFYPDEILAVRALLLVPDGAVPGKTPAVVCLPGSGASLETLAGEPAAHFTRYPLRNRQGWWYAKAGMIALCLENPVAGDNCHDDLEYYAQLNAFRHLIATLGWCEEGVATREILACVAYLKGHPLVDPKKIALSALSRGCQAAWSALLSDDVAALVYNDYVCSGLQQQMSVTEHGPWSQEGGTDVVYPEPDVLAAMAPKPVLFTEGGHWNGVVSEIARAYELVGASGNFTFLQYAKYADKAMRPHDDEDLRTTTGLSPDQFLAWSNCDPQQHSFHAEKALPWLSRLFFGRVEFSDELKVAFAEACAERERCPTAAAHPLPRIERKRLFPGFDGTYCKVQPSVATDGRGLSVLGFQRLLLTGADVFYGQYLSKSTDGGETWSEPREMTALKDTREDGLRIVRYVTVYYNRRNDRWYGLGQAATYRDDKVPNHDCRNGNPYSWPIFVTIDPETATCSESRRIDFPLPFVGCLPFGQQVECENGDLLVPVYYEPPELVKEDDGAFDVHGRIVVVRFRFEGESLKVVETGMPIACDGLRRGIVEPSLVQVGSRYYLTVRSDEAGMWCESDDGLRFSEPRRWTWTDGTEIGNRNTQQHWMIVGGTPYLAYTRETPANRHVFRNRAPVYLSEFDLVAGGLVRATETTLVPELGARLGNFCCTPDGRDGSWLLTAEWMQPKGCEKYGSDNSLWLCRVKPAVKHAHGALCLTFDDRHFENWKRALPTFRKYRAHATFFPYGALDEKALETMRILRSEGHSLGLHGMAHAKAVDLMAEYGENGYLLREIVPQVEAARKAGLQIRNWGYPMSCRNGGTDRALGRFFDRMKAGCLWRETLKSDPLSGHDEVFVPMAEVPTRRLFWGTPVPTALDGWEDDVRGALKRAADRNELLHLYAHDIRAGATSDPHHISVGQLETILAAARELGVAVIGWDEF